MAGSNALAAYTPGYGDLDAARRRHDAATFFELPAGRRKRVVSVKLDPSIVEEIDQVWPELGYTSRSQFIREAIIYYMLIAKVLHRDRDLCICRCNDGGQPRRLEDFLAERLAEYAEENLLQSDEEEGMGE